MTTNNSAFRTITIEKSGSLSLRDGLLLLENDDGTFEFAISQLTSVMIATQKLSITSALLKELQENHVSVIICNEKRQPIGVMHALGINGSSAGNLMMQAEWQKERKDLIWSKIVRQKIIGSAKLLRRIGNTVVADELLKYADEVTVGDITNREAVSAKCYFHALFGYTFNREQASDINGALNYGYAIIASKINRYLAGSGYSTALGIHHCSRVNFWNLTYDLIEPFRVFVDRLVWELQKEEFDWQYKKVLIEICEAPVKFCGKNTLLSSAIEAYCHRVLVAMNESDVEKINIGMVEML